MKSDIISTLKRKERELKELRRELKLEQDTSLRYARKAKKLTKSLMCVEKELASQRERRETFEAYVFFIFNSHSLKSSILSTFNLHICIYIYSISLSLTLLVTHILIHTLIQIITHTYVTLEPQVFQEIESGENCDVIICKRNVKFECRT